MADRLTITVDECAQLLGISRGLAYEQVRQGIIPHVRFGRRIVIPVVALEKMLGGAEQHCNDHEE